MQERGIISDDWSLHFLSEWLVIWFVNVLDRLPSTAVISTTTQAPPTTEISTTETTSTADETTHVQPASTTDMWVCWVFSSVMICYWIFFISLITAYYKPTVPTKLDYCNSLYRQNDNSLHGWRCQLLSIKIVDLYSVGMVSFQEWVLEDWPWLRGQLEDFDCFGLDEAWPWSWSEIRLVYLGWPSLESSRCQQSALVEHSRWLMCSTDLPVQLWWAQRHKRHLRQKSVLQRPPALLLRPDTQNRSPRPICESVWCS